jgi:hypothetical protein
MNSAPRLMTPCRGICEGSPAQKRSALTGARISKQAPAEGIRGRELAGTAITAKLAKGSGRGCYPGPIRDAQQPSSDKGMQREDALAIAAPNARKPSRVGMQLVVPLVRTNGPAQIKHDDPALGVGQLVVELLCDSRQT